MTITIEQVCQRWSDPTSRPLFKGSLISNDGCCCAQGDVLRLSGYTDNQLRAMEQTKADREVARLLGISTAHAVLLRIVNDRRDGCPQDVLLQPEKIVGPEWPTLKKFWCHLDRMTGDDWKKVVAARTAAKEAAGTAAWAVAGAAARTAARTAAQEAAGTAAQEAAWDAAGTAAWDAARTAAWTAARTAAWEAAEAAAWEIQGRSRLNKFVFLPMFGFTTPDEIK